MRALLERVEGSWNANRRTAARGFSHRVSSTPAVNADDTQRRVLVVEDEWLVRMEIADALNTAGWQILESGSGEDAMTLLDPASPIHLLITDIRLGGLLTGWDVAERFRAAVPAVCVIYASANPALDERLVPGGIFMSKPTRMTELVAISDRLWRAAVPPAAETN